MDICTRITLVLSETNSFAIWCILIYAKRFSYNFCRDVMDNSYLRLFRGKRMAVRVGMKVVMRTRWNNVINTISTQLNVKCVILAISGLQCTLWVHNIEERGNVIYSFIEFFPKIFHNLQRFPICVIFNLTVLHDWKTSVWVEYQPALLIQKLWNLLNRICKVLKN